ncbi:MAG: hypothetical protein FWG18_02115 [Alphaproteobacteria bacterium]|nr:hypothetical protein [Alphaproteobacteria bacterium]
MSSRSKSFLFITYRVTRGLAALGAALQKSGHNVAIASASPIGITRTLRVPHIRIRRLKLFGRRFLIPSDPLRNFLKSQTPAIFAVDDAANLLCRRMKLETCDKPIEFGLDLNLFSPKCVSVSRIAAFLQEYNIAPHQKMITVISPLGRGIDTLLAAMRLISDPSLVVAFYGFAKPAKAKKIISKIQESGQVWRTVYIGEDADLPTVMRSSFATISCAEHDRDMLMAAVALARPTIWPNNIHGINANISLLDDATAEDIADALNHALSLSQSKREAIEKENVIRAKEFAIEKSIEQVVGR